MQEETVAKPGHARDAERTEDRTSGEASGSEARTRRGHGLLEGEKVAAAPQPPKPPVQPPAVPGKTASVPPPKAPPKETPLEPVDIEAAMRHPLRESDRQRLGLAELQINMLKPASRNRPPPLGHHQPEPRVHRRDHPPHKGPARRHRRSPGDRPSRPRTPANGSTCPSSRNPHGAAVLSRRLTALPSRLPGLPSAPPDRS